MAMNYSSGFFRLYLVLSICWMATWLFLGITKSSDLRLNASRREQLDGIVRKMMDQDETDDDIQVVVDDFKQKYGERSWAITLRRVVTSDTLAIAFVPPVVGYGIAFIVPWIGRGFRATKSN